MPVSRTMWLRGIEIDSTKMKRNARDERDARTKNISALWKNGIKFLVEENDKMQAEHRIANDEANRVINTFTKPPLYMGPPAGVDKSVWLKNFNVYMKGLRDQQRITNEQNIKEVSLRWKEGYRALKDANNSMTKENEATYHKEIAEIDSIKKSQIKQGPPNG